MVAEEATGSLLAELESDQRGQGGHCSTRMVLEAMPAEARQEWEAAMRDPRFTAASIYRAAERRNVPFTEQSIQRHVRRLRFGTGCQCPR